MALPKAAVPWLPFDPPGHHKDAALERGLDQVLGLVKKVGMHWCVVPGRPDGSFYLPDQGKTASLI